MKARKYSDLVVLILIGYFISVGIFAHFNNGNILSLNFYLGFICWLVTIYFKYIRKEKRSFVPCLIVLGTLNILIYSASVFSFGSVHYLYNDNEIIITSLGVSPLFLLILIIYCLVNFDLVRRLYYGSDKENADKLKVAVSFYYDKFNGYSAEELKEVFKMYKDYPEEAKIALMKIHQEKALTLMEY